MLPMQPYIRFFSRRKRRVHRIRKLQASSLLRHFLNLLFMLVLLIAAHTGAMVYFEKMSAPDALWLSLTTATTVGYGDFSAQTLNGRAATVVLLYVGGIALLAQAVGVYFEYRQDRRHNMLTGRWRWYMRDHIVFINEPASNADDYFIQAIGQLRNSHAPEACLPVLLTGKRFPQGLPDEMRSLDIAHLFSTRVDAKMLEEADTRYAAIIVLMATDTYDIASDSVNFDLICRLRESGVRARIICEAVSPENRSRLLRAGADAVLRPIRIYPEMLSRAIISPGSEKIIENLFSNDNEECVRLDVPVSGVWRDIAIRCLEADMGMAIAFIDMHGEVHTAPPAGEYIHASGLFILRRSSICSSLRDAPRVLADFYPREAV